MCILVAKKDNLNGEVIMLLECVAVEFLSPIDERIFFDWLEKINGVSGVYGQGLSIMLKMDDSINDESLRELLALFYRYGIDMKQLGTFRNKDNQSWFYDNKQSFWFEKVFPK